jgi:putative DNA methylase
MMTTHPVKRRKKLIEVAIPLEAINAASAREKSIRHGHPSTLHLWWARRPLAAARAVIFCQMVDDPSAVSEEFPTEEDQENERLRLFKLISELVQWENTTNEQVLNRAREEIRRSWRRCCADNADHPEAADLFNPEKLPGFHDPFAGGGALPLEAQRLGLEAYASDLNPVAVLINKAMIEIPPKFAGMPPVNPEARSKKQLIERQWKGAEGLAEDVHYYGIWMREEAEKRIGHLYPKVEVTSEMAHERPDLKPYVGQKLTVIAWLWARTVKSPNPAFQDIDVPLASTFTLSAKRGAGAYVEPILSSNGYKFAVRTGDPVDLDQAKNGTKLARANFRCLMSGSPISGDYIKQEGFAGRIGARLMATVLAGSGERVYVSPSPEIESTALSAAPEWKPAGEIARRMTGGNCTPYGLVSWGDLFTDRQLVTLTLINDLVREAGELVRRDYIEKIGVNHLSNNAHLEESRKYADGVMLYLALSADRLADRNSSLCGWDIAQALRGREATVRNVFARQAIPMVWDFVEVNTLGDSAGSYDSALRAVYRVIEAFDARMPGNACQRDASTQEISRNKVVSTDPPYYDNIGYADLSDFFYVWLRRSLRSIFPDLCATLAVPKNEELVASAYRHGGRDRAEEFFLNGMTNAMHRISCLSHPAFPVTIYYAFKQSEAKSSGGTASTGWETFLAAVIEAGFALHGTWPIRTELANRMIGSGANALASSIVLVCKRRAPDAKRITRRQFRDELKKLLPQAIKELERANIAPVDVAQASIGPGMAIFSASAAVLNPDDSPMTVREALVEINAALDEYLSQDEGELDPDSRFALTFFESFGYQERDYGDAEGLAVARNISVAGVAEAGILRSVAGKVRLLQRSELADDWDPTSDNRLCVWEATQQLIKRLEADGESSAAGLLLQLKGISTHGDLAANCRALAYRLYNHCEKTKQAEEARSYNGLVIAWPELERQASAASSAQSSPLQTSLI